MDDTFLFVIVIIGAIIFAVYLTYTTSHDDRKGGSDQRKSLPSDDLSDFGSEHHETSYVYGEDFRGIQEMSQYQNLMFSDAVYLFGKLFSRYGQQEGLYGKLEELPDGTWVRQKNLAEQVVLAAFAYLYQKQLIAIALGERKSFFRKIKTATVKTLQTTAPDLSGVEAAIFFSLQYNEYYGNGITHMYGLTQAVIPYQGNPWHEVLKIVKENLLQRGILKHVVKVKILFITTYKYVVNGDISQDLSQAAKQIAELQKTLKEFQSKGELYQQLLSDIHEGIASRESRGD